MLNQRRFDLGDKPAPRRLRDVDGFRALSGAVSSARNRHRKQEFAPDGKTAAVIDVKNSEVGVWSAQDGEPVKVRTPREDEDIVVSAAFSADGGTLATGSPYGDIGIWMVGEDEPRRTLTGPDRSTVV